MPSSRFFLQIFSKIDKHVCATNNRCILEDHKHRYVNAPFFAPHRSANNSISLYQDLYDAHHSNGSRPRCSLLSRLHARIYGAPFIFLKSRNDVFCFLFFSLSKKKKTARSCVHPNHHHYDSWQRHFYVLFIGKTCSVDKPWSKESRPPSNFTNPQNLKKEAKMTRLVLLNRFIFFKGTKRMLRSSRSLVFTMTSMYFLVHLPFLSVVRDCEVAEF